MIRKDWQTLLTATPSFSQPADPHIHPFVCLSPVTNLTFLSLTYSVILSSCIVVVSAVSCVDLVSTYSPLLQLNSWVNN